ncbi:MAG: DUF177 domain-containing protein [Bacteroidota bacterium]
MIIKYTNFSDGIHSFHLSESVKNLGLEELFFGNADVECRMDKSPHQIVLDCDLTVHSKMICDRCAKDLETKLTNHFQISYLFSRDLHETDEYNLKYLSPEDDKINIRNDVYEYAELALPMKRLCKDDCKGLCPHCGKKLNEEECNCKIESAHDVWEPLKQLWKSTHDQSGER